MSDRRDQADDPIEAELRSWFKSRTTPAAPSTLHTFADQVGSGARPTAPLRGLTVGWRQPPGRPSCRRRGVHRRRRPRRRSAPGRRAGRPAATTSSPGTSQAVVSSQRTGSPPATPTATPSATPSADVAARYPDGIPSTLLGHHVYRPDDLRQTVPAGSFLLGGWNAGAIVSACIPIVPGASNPPCPSFLALAETRGGPVAVSVRWGRSETQGAPALVLRVTAEPAPTCVSTPPGSCPGPSLTVQDVLWAGDPSGSASPSPSLPKGSDCSASQLVLGRATSAYGFGSLGTTVVFVTQPIRNSGPECLLRLPETISGGAFRWRAPASDRKQPRSRYCV